MNIGFGRKGGHNLERKRMGKEGLKRKEGKEKKKTRRLVSVKSKWECEQKQGAK